MANPPPQGHRPRPVAARWWKNGGVNDDHRAAALELLAGAARDGQLAGRSFRVRGGCMAPLLVDGDRVELAPPGAPPRPGQVVLARVASELLCHRLLEREGGLYRVAGDRDLRLDAVPEEDLIGRVVAIVTPRFGGARLDLAAPTRADLFFAAWQAWSCRGRGFLALRLEGLRRRLLARRAARRWAAAATVATVAGQPSRR